MSIPGLLAQPMAQTIIGALTPLETVLAFFNTNTYFIGFMMLFLNLGGRFLMLEVIKEQEHFFQNPWVRRFLIFIVLFIATRSIATAFWLTLVSVLVLGYLFNENSALCVFKSGRPGSKCAKDGDKDAAKGGLTPDEQEILRRLSEKNTRYSKKPDDDKDDSNVDVTQIYGANIQLLQSGR